MKRGENIVGGRWWDIGGERGNMVGDSGGERGR